MPNYVEAFAAYCRGKTIDDICESYDIPKAALFKRMEEDNWVGLRTIMVSVPVIRRPDLHPLAEARLNLIEEHRMTVLQNAKSLQRHLGTLLGQLAEGKLMVKKVQLNAKAGSWAEIDVPPSTGDLVNIATYAKIVAELGYRALGDLAGGEKGSPDAPAGAGSQTPAVTIILPGAIGAPRDQRGKTVIDLRPEAAVNERVVTEEAPK